MTTSWLRIPGLLGILLALMLTGFAQTSPTELTPLSLEECIALAQENHTDILIGEQNINASLAQQTQTRSSLYPQVGVSASKNITGNDGGGNNRDGLSLAVTQNFYDGGLREARIARAGDAVTQSNAQLDRTRQTITFNVVKNYLALLRAKRLTEVTEKRVTYITGQRAMVQARVEAGDAAAVDALPLEAQLANAKVDLIANKNAERSAAIKLQQAMGLRTTSSFQVQPINTLTTPVAMPSPEDLVTKALAQRPEIRQNQASIAMAKSSVRTARINSAPRPFVNGSFDQPLGNGSQTNTATLAMGVSLNLFDGNNTRAALDESNINLTNAELRAAQTTRDIAADIDDAWVNYENARARMDASAVSVNAAQKNLEAQQERYGQGLAITLDLVNAQLEVTTASSNAVQAQYDYLTALAQLNYALGNKGGISWE